METILLATTIVSLTIALVMGVVAWRGARDGQLRRAARVAALRAAAEREAFLTASQLADELPLRAEPPVPAPGTDLFAAAATPAPASRQRGLAWAAGALLVVLAGAGVSMYSGPAPPGATATTTPLELLTLRHERAGATVQVSGLVRNPAGASQVDRLTAVVFLFDDTGAFLTSARAPVDFLRLAPGDDTPFVVALPAAPNAARYRVSFRTDAGIVAHIDRRAPVAAADATPVAR
ncbi:MAG: hypothetical protein Q8L86_00745 [Vicinamibacterales bacterium]|nr:hypothetical protein [Vicinamibacterales bacterium]